jgi:hypothetical protein
MSRYFAESALVASLSAATNGFAADLPKRTYTKAPVMVDAGYNWTGFYAGINGGYSWGRANGTAPIGAPYSSRLGSARKPTRPRKVANQGKSVPLALDAMMPMVPILIDPNASVERPRSPVPWISASRLTTQFRSSCQL